MTRTISRVALAALLAGVILSGGLTVLANPGSEGRGGFSACPFPRTCMAPCILDRPPTVLCKLAGGPVVRTTYACCCCGSAGGRNSVKPLR